MAQIGQFTRLRGIFTGELKTLSIDRHLVFIPVVGLNAPHAPNYTIRLKDADGPEVGVGWKRTGERTGEYISIVLDDPIFAVPLRSNLFQKDDDKKVWVLIWKRDDVRKSRPEEPA